MNILASHEIQTVTSIKKSKKKHLFAEAVGRPQRAALREGEAGLKAWPRGNGGIAGSH